MSQRFKVRFRLSPVHDVHSIILPQGYGIDAVREGFWVNSNFVVSVASEDKFFILPHMIELVERVYL